MLMLLMGKQINKQTTRGKIRVPVAEHKTINNAQK